MRDSSRVIQYGPLIVFIVFFIRLMCLRGGRSRQRTDPRLLMEAISSELQTVNGDSNVATQTTHLTCICKQSISRGVNVTSGVA